MRLLLDTHALLWWLAGDEQLTLKARKALADRRHEIVVSAASGWEVTTKHRLGKLPMAGPLAVDFDRVLIAQAREERLALVSNDTVFDDYGTLPDLRERHAIDRVQQVDPVGRLAELRDDIRREKRLLVDDRRRRVVAFATGSRPHPRVRFFPETAGRP